MMKRSVAALLALTLIWLCLAETPRAAARAEGDQPAEWKVLLYLCGSDLESKHGFASAALEEMLQVEWAYSIPTIQKLWGEATEDDAPHSPGRVEVLIETGGSSKWHSSAIEHSDVTIDAGHLQRWQLTNYFPEAMQQMTLEQELPLASMGDAQTLADFIRWGVENHPAKRYALVLWDHGGGGKTGLFLDELFDNDILYLDELKTALHDGEAQFDTVIFDACLMANLETACAVKDNARWMTASEEFVPGQGSAIGAWLQELYNNPLCDGEQLGRMVCDMTQRKYADLGNDQDNLLLSWSVVDLSKIDRLAADFDRLFEVAGRAYEELPMALYLLMHSAHESEEYGNGDDNMIDLGGMLYHPNTTACISPAFRGELLEALSEAVKYSVRGPGRSSALGLSFCLATDFDPDELSAYARNCPSPNYLALLDAISEWTAPERVYERARRLPKIDGMDRYAVRVEKRVHDAIPVIQLAMDIINYKCVRYWLYRLDAETGQTVRLGGDVCIYKYLEDDTQIWYPDRLSRWPAVEGVLCDVEPISESRLVNVFNIPVQIGSEAWNLRCGHTYDVNPMEQIAARGEIWDHGEYEVYGLWEGYDSHSEMPGRNTRPLSQMAGRDYRLLYPAVSATGATTGICEYSDEMKMYRALEIGEITLPVGDYYLEYEVEDMFGRSMKLDKVKIQWDGEAFALAEGAVWQGGQKLAVRARE